MNLEEALKEINELSSLLVNQTQKNYDLEAEVTKLTQELIDVTSKMEKFRSQNKGLIAKLKMGAFV